MRFEPLPLRDARRVITEPSADERGSFSRLYCADAFAANGLPSAWPQTSMAVNAQKGTLRGLHFQGPPQAEAKLVRCSRGRAFDVIVDLRAGSPTFARWHGEVLDADTPVQLYVPAGFAHGYLTLTDHCVVDYMHGAPYAPTLQGGVHHADPDLSIAWPAPITLCSARDHTLPSLKQLENPFR